MRKLIAVSLAGGLLAAMTATGFACPYNSASIHGKMTVAEAETPAADQEAMSTFDPGQLKQEAEEKAE